jgi:hypothetical protein
LEYRSSKRNGNSEIRGDITKLNGLVFSPVCGHTEATRGLDVNPKGETTPKKRENAVPTALSSEVQML